MAQRPAWTICDGKIIRRDFSFVWNPGFAITQKQKNIRNLHDAIFIQSGGTALEISSKSDVELGKNIGAFTLKIKGIALENIFQGAKKYEKGGPFTDLLNVTAKESKRDERHGSSGKLVSFVHNGIEWPLEPKTAFYDYIYVRAMLENFGKSIDLSEYDWFTDIEFNPERSINCQARSAAIYKLLLISDDLKAADSKDTWIKFHRNHVIS